MCMSGNNYKICPFCHNKIFLKGNHCYHCGKKLPQNFFDFFEDSNNSNRGIIKFCPNCGCKMIEGREQCGIWGQNYEKIGIGNIIRYLLILILVLGFIYEYWWVVFILIWIIGGIAFTKGNVTRVNSAGIVRESNGWPQYCLLSIIVLAVVVGIYSYAGKDSHKNNHTIAKQKNISETVTYPSHEVTNKNIKENVQNPLLKNQQKIETKNSEEKSKKDNKDIHTYGTIYGNRQRIQYLDTNGKKEYGYINKGDEFIIIGWNPHWKTILTHDGRRAFLPSNAVKVLGRW